MSIEMTASLFRSYANEEKPVRRRVSRRKDEEGCGTSDVDTEVDVQRGFVVSLKLCRTRGSLFSSSCSVVLQRHCAAYTFGRIMRKG